MVVHSCGSSATMDLSRPPSRLIVTPLPIKSLFEGRYSFMYIATGPPSFCVACNATSMNNPDEPRRQPPNPLRPPTTVAKARWLVAAVFAMENKSFSLMTVPPVVGSVIVNRRFVLYFYMLCLLCVVFITSSIPFYPTGYRNESRFCNFFSAFRLHSHRCHFVPDPLSVRYVATCVGYARCLLLSKQRSLAIRLCAPHAAEVICFVDSFQLASLLFLSFFQLRSGCWFSWHPPLFLAPHARRFPWTIMLNRLRTIFARRIVRCPLLLLCVVSCHCSRRSLCFRLQLYFFQCLRPYLLADSAFCRSFRCSHSFASVCRVCLHSKDLRDEGVSGVNLLS